MVSLFTHVFCVDNIVTREQLPLFCFEWISLNPKLHMLFDNVPNLSTNWAFKKKFNFQLAKLLNHGFSNFQLLDSHQLFCHSYGKLWCSRKLHAYWLWLLLETDHHLQSNAFNMMLSLNENSTWEGSKGRPNGRPNNMMTFKDNSLVCWSLVYHHGLHDF